MIFQYPQASKTTQVLKDLIKINNDRIGGYQAALNQSSNLDPAIRQMFSEIISEGVTYRAELTQKVRQLDPDVRTNPNILGKIYMAWNDLKIAFGSTTQKSIIASCLYNEEIALHAYKAAISKDTGISHEVLQLLGEQESGLRRNYELLKCYREIRHTAAASLLQLV
jgi:uncharacterized protein (TIGR02284 family)